MGDPAGIRIERLGIGGARMTRPAEVTPAAIVEDRERVTKQFLEDAREYLERVCDWYEGGNLPGEIAAKDLIVRCANLLEGS